MKILIKNSTKIIVILLLHTILANAQSNKISKQTQPLLFPFNQQLQSGAYTFKGDTYSFVDGIHKKALSFTPTNDFATVKLDLLSLDGAEDFTVQFWIKTTSKNATVLLSQKEFLDKGIVSQKNAGWAWYSSGGTFAWTIGSGNRRLNYERSNGDKAPLNDGNWHQLTMTYSKELSEIRLYYDGQAKAIYNVGFEFKNTNPLTIGSQKNSFNYDTQILPSITNGATTLQALVDAFNNLEIEHVTEEEFLSLIVDPKELYLRKSKISTETLSQEKEVFFNAVMKARSKLSANPYTVFQNMELTKLKPISKLYSLKNGQVTINMYHANKYTQEERLYPSDFSMDELSIWKRTLTPEEVHNNYSQYKNTTAFKLKEKQDTITVASWNIWHGGKHFTVNGDGWDSRLRIAEMIKENNIDIVLMQETYSSGDYIAAELGYYFATTSDWDYCFQGSNISVLSRYPIEKLEVLKETEFMNVAVKISISNTQQLFAMSNWYGMSSFPLVYDFHQENFNNSDEIPIFFGGDFNAVPYTDGGDNPASVQLMENGFTDAYRSLYSNFTDFPGYSHASGSRIDQLYYKGKGLTNTATKIISTWPSGFPSDHNLILSKFELK
ncbi:endonuclease/exonuclease/phosphatase family protein [Cellulophaga sp. F20128]|uniref:endonuclease/exonuclease/phosphatase family protein n=1 Tax=Cellulophaga sp. F20128 TaxID=2926413 RepID=UPI001FF6EBDB|nr:endonuclease/exonuclease/phosphatase family protein [Cellulophaga sp. F20128]MCK0156932.1 endonuclease/exonuclease/phosphatase family protein [Cellulophaga sp. F20128]